MLDGFTLATAHDVLYLYCGTCGDEAEACGVYMSHVVDLGPVLADARAHYAAAHVVDPLPPAVRYGVFEADGGYQVRDREEGKNVGFVYTHEADARYEAQQMNEMEAAA